MQFQARRYWLLNAILALAFYCGNAGGESEKIDSVEADIARETATLLNSVQFSRHPLDAALSSQFLDSYLNALDSAHVLFLQRDLDEFEHFRSSLAPMILTEGETRPAHIIYARYLKRLAQQVNFETELLRSAKFDFTGCDSWQIDRHDAAPPRDLAAAKGIWRMEVRADYLQEELANSPAAEIARRLARLYEGRLQTMRRLKPNEILKIFLNALAHVYDPHSNYFGREELENFNIEMDLSLVGVGATLQPKDGYYVIGDLAPGGPAARSEVLKPGDRIMAVAQGTGGWVDIRNMPTSQVIDLIRGTKGSTVRFSVISSGVVHSMPKTVSLVRDEIRLADAHAKETIIDLPQKNWPALRIGVIDLPSFYRDGKERSGGASADTARLVNKAKEDGVSGLILDLRRNGGGAVEEAVALTGLFIPSGPVVQTCGLTGDVDIDTSPEAHALYDGPLVVLTSRLSASASEIVAGALQDYGRALIVGDFSTFGKGTVQTIVPLKEFLPYPDLGAVQLTIGKFYRPSGASVQLRGVLSDIVLPSETDLSEICESKLPKALPWDILPLTTYTNFNLVKPSLDVLRKKSHARTAVDPGFRLILEEEAIANEEAKAQLLSLNEAVRRRQKTKVKDIRVEMDKMLLAKKSSMPPSHLIALADFDPVSPTSICKPTKSASTSKQPMENSGPVDIELWEAERILADYISVLGAETAGGAIAGTEPRETR